jgi:hypothetical protein
MEKRTLALKLNSKRKRDLKLEPVMTMTAMLTLTTNYTRHYSGMKSVSDESTQNFYHIGQVRNGQMITGITLIGKWLLIKSNEYRRPIQNLHIHGVHQIQTHISCIEDEYCYKTPHHVGFKLNMITSLLHHKEEAKAATMDESCNNPVFSFS